MRIVAVGGGDKTAAIKAALQDTENTRTLIIPSACSTERSYNTKVPKIVKFFRDLGIACTVLHELQETPSQTKIAEEFGQAGLLYVIGGHTPTLLSRLTEHGTGQAIIQAVVHDNKIIAGVSAGALAPFQVIHSNPSKKPGEERWDFVYLDGLSMLGAVATAHANQHDQTPAGPRPDTRMEHLLANFPADRVSTGIALDNHAALIVNGDNSFVVLSEEGKRSRANVHVLASEGDRIIATPVEDSTHITAVINDITPGR